ncbi:MAG: right-handed parallel beta-helix repeat-containing protein [Candidatus Heimdallarchaeaceae archaeon]
MNQIKITKLTIKICLTIFIIFALMFQATNGSFATLETENETVREINLTLTDGIVINNANIASYSSSGTGAIDDPYIIDNLNINTTDSLAIQFYYVTSYYVLRDSNIKGSTYGVYVDGGNSGGATIINCTLEGNFAVGGSNNPYMTVYNNTLKTVDGENFGSGINFTKNVVYSTGSGLMSISHYDNIVKDNVFYGNKSELAISSITNSTIENNILHNGGFNVEINTISDLLNNSFENNLVNGRPLGLLVNLADTIVTGNQYGQIYIANSTNIEIEGYSFDNVYVGLQVFNSTNISINNVNITSRLGITAETADGLSIENCNFIGEYYGIQTEEVYNDFIIQNNYFEGFRNAIELISSDKVKINNNTIIDAQKTGIALEEGSDLEIMFNIITCHIVDEGYQSCIDLYGFETASIYYNVFIGLGNEDAFLVEEWSVTSAVWYNNSLAIGNYYSNLNGSSSYAIGGNGGTSDIYPFIDIDEDTLNESMEVLVYHTNPFSNDSDSDGLTDNDEIDIFLTNPMDEDTDSDGLNDGEEVFVYLTNPLNNDTDSDGFADGEEIAEGTDPLDENDFPIVIPEFGTVSLILLIATLFPLFFVIRYRKNK